MEKMLARMLGRVRDDRLWIAALVSAVLLGAVVAGYVASPLPILLLAAAFGGLGMLQWPILGLLCLPFVALVAPIEIGTGTEVALNPSTVLVPVMLGIWILDMARKRHIHLVPSATSKPLFLFLVAGLLSLLIGTATWDPAVPRSGNFALVQAAQWGIFAFSAGAFWLAGNLIHDETWLRRLTFLFLLLAGCLVIIFVPNMLATSNSQFVAFFNSRTTDAFYRAPFPVLLAALAGGQLLFNRALSTRRRLFLWVVMGACLIYVFHLQSSNASYWIAVTAALGVLAWLRWPRLRWPAIFLLAVLAVSGVLFSAVYEFAGGGAEWAESGGSRLALIGRVLEVTMRNPITGLGPAAYRPYAGMEPLLYGRAYWVNPLINSHNNYVDLFSQVGLLGLALFFWFAAELARLGLRLRTRFREGFAAGYVNGVLAAGAGALVLMLFADWLLPFVYNIGFPGFQASVLVWLFLGGLVSLEQVMNRELAQ